jgi:predicted MFS family arabinose efflux permease
MAVFFMQAVMLANWIPRIPDVQARLGLSAGDLSIGLLGMSFGSFVALAIAGTLIERLTPRITIVVGFIGYATLLTLPGWAWDVPSLFIALFLLGMIYPLVDVAMNVEAARIQEAEGRRILSTCHGFWSIGSTLGALAGSGFAALGVATGWHLLVVAAIGMPVAILVGRALPEVPPTRAEKGQRRLPFALPSAAMIGLCIFCFGSVMCETTARNWGAIYLRDVLYAGPGAAGLGYAAFSLFMAGGRLLGDRLTGRFGPARLARVCCSIALIGMTVVVAAGNAWLAVAGMAATGFGVSIVYPLSVTAAAGRGDRAAALNVVALSFAAFNAFLIGTPLTGFVADAWGLRAGLATVLPAIAASALLAGEVSRRRAAIREAAATV